MALRCRARLAVVCTTAFALFATSLPVPAQARLVATEQVMEIDQTSAERDQVRQFLAREDVRQQMAGMGVSADEATHRVDAMTDEEVRRVAGHLRDMPAGGDALGLVIGTAVLIFIILLLTDIFGLTKVFPWTRSVR